jgi:ribonuclease VapC
VIVDTSALLAVLFDEPEAPAFADMMTTSLVGVGAPTLAETAIVLQSRLAAGRAEHVLGRLMATIDAEVIPFSADHWQVSLHAFRRYGRGRHPAALNFGDCLSYAVATRAAQPLLAKGADFPLTDVALVAY